MCIRCEIMELMVKEQPSREEMAEIFVEDRCMAEEFKEEFPSKCNEDGGYCYDCWKERIDKFIDEELPN